MATIRYNYAFLRDSDVANNQSRGISLQFNGYALLSAPLPTTIPDLFDPDKSEEKIKYVPSLNDLINAGVTVLYRDINYTVNSGVARSADRNYESALKNPAIHMFQDLVVRAADEYKLLDNLGTSSGQTEVQIPVYDTMFGNRINGALRVDGILLYGQAYNKDFYSEVQQGKIENSTPIGIIYFDGDGPEIDPSSGATSKDKSVIRFLLGIMAAKDLTTTVMQNSEASYSAWSAFRGNVHVVNENLLTTSSFVVHGHDVIPTDDPSVESAVDEEGNPVGYGAVLNRGPTIDVQSRMFFTNDVPGANNFDHNVDFGSPARLTVLTHDEAVEFSHGQKDIGANQKYAEDRKPQTMLGKVSYYDDQAGFKHAYMDGIVESYFTASGRREEGYKGNGKFKSTGRYTSGPVWDVDWISKNRPAFSLFSENPNYNFDDYSWADYLLEVEGSSVPAGLQKTVNDNSACFARGVNMFTIDSQAVDGVNINTRQVVTRGNAFVINSNRCTVFTRAPSEDDIEKSNTLNKFTAFIANSQDVTIRDRVKGTSSDDSKDKKYHAVRGKTNPLNTVINSTRISIDNRAPGLNIMNTEDFGRNTVLGSHNVSLKVADDNIILGVKGYFTKNGKNKKNPAPNWSHIENTRALRAFGGPMYVNYAKDCFIFGTGDSENTLNKLEGYIDYDGTTRERIYGSMIFGENNQISTLYRYKPWNGNNAGEIHYSYDEHNVFLFGKGLRNDVRQTRALLSESSDATTPTFIFGINNQDYYQPKQVKQFIIGGYRPNSTAYYNGDFRYNMSEFSVVYPDPIKRNGTQNWNKESILTLNDVKGRTIDYGSGAINLGFMKGVRSDQQFAHQSAGHPSYKGFGRINLFKLYQLLKRLYWVPEGDGAVVKYYKDFHDDEWGGTFNWRDYGTDTQDTCLANLVDDNLCQYQYFPEKGPNR